VSIPELTPHQLARWIDDEEELAVIDVRDLGPFSQAHLWCAVSIPYSRLELSIVAFVPRLNTRIVICDNNDGLAIRAAKTLHAIGYTSLYRLEGGVDYCFAEKFDPVDGNYNLAHAFGYFIQDTFHTPTITAHQLRQQIDNGDDLILIDSRTETEYRRSSLPGSINIPVEQLLSRIGEYVSSSNTRIVVHCAGITRGILGGQSLISAGIENPVSVLLHGTKGWLAAGFSTIPNQVIIENSNPEIRHFRWKENIGFSGLKYIGLAELTSWLSETDSSTTYLIDVRSTGAYRDAHLQGFRSVPGGELAGMTCDHIATIGARICLVGDESARDAEITAFWLQLLGWEVAILQKWEDAGPIEIGPELCELPQVGYLDSISPSDLFELRASENIYVIDVASSEKHTAGHIQSAHWTLRSHLPSVISQLQPSNGYIITSEDGIMAQFVARELEQEFGIKASALYGGTNAWAEHGFPIEAGMCKALCETDDFDVVMREPSSMNTDIRTKYFEQYNSWRESLYERYLRQNYRPFRR